MTPEALVEFAESLARIAAAGGGPKALTAHLAQRTGAAVLLEDARWRHVAAAGAGHIPASGRPTVERGAPGKALRVTLGNNHLGWLSLFGENTAPDVDALMRLTAAVVGVELSRDGAGARARKEDFWEALVGGAFHDAGSVRDEAAAHGISLASTYVSVVLEGERCGAERSALDAAELRPLAREAFRSTEPELGLADRGLTLVVFVPATRSIDASNARTAASLLPKSAARRDAQLRISGGIGTAQTLLALASSVAAARAALSIGRRIYGSGHVAQYETLGAYPLLYEGAGVERLRAFASATLTPLRAYDEKHQTELEKTLRVYFELGENVKTAAATLNVHRHTVFYRLRQIGEIAGKSFESPHDQLTLRLAVAIHELHESP